LDAKRALIQELPYLRLTIQIFVFFQKDFQQICRT